MIGFFLLSLMIETQQEKEQPLPSLDAFVFSSPVGWTVWLSGIPYEALGPTQEGWSLFRVTEKSIFLKHHNGKEVILSA